MRKIVLIWAMCLGLVYFSPATTTNYVDQSWSTQVPAVTPHRASYSPAGPNRNSDVVHFLRVGVDVLGASGGICYYDSINKRGYILTCAHIFPQKELDAYPVRTFYVGDRYVKRNFEARLLAISRFEDLALLLVDLPFPVDYAPIGPQSSSFFNPEMAPVGQRVIVVGRDNHTDPAAYEAFIRNPPSGNGWFLESRQYPSKGGRSGAPVMTEDRKWIIAINYGRGTTQDGIGHGKWNSLNRIHRFVKKHGYGWLIDPNVPASLPVYDEEGHRLHVPQGYVPDPC